MAQLLAPVSRSERKGHLDQPSSSLWSEPAAADQLATGNSVRDQSLILKAAATLAVVLGSRTVHLVMLPCEAGNRKHHVDLSICT